MPFMLSSFNERVSKFGVELELLSRYDDDYDEDGCDCEECPYCERSSDGNVGEMLRIFRGYNLTEFHHLHEYHCDCGDCDYTRRFGFFAAQRDCTVGMEFITRILDVHNASDVANLNRVPDALRQGYSRTGWSPDGDQDNGNHIHVALDGSGTDVRFRASTITGAHDWLFALSAEVDLTSIADGGCGQIRGYNGDGARKARYSDYDRATSWFSHRRSTMEFRLFNTPSITDRVPMHATMAVGMFRWALTMAIRHRDFTPAQRDAHMESTSNARIGRQIIDCLPDMGWRDQSADLIASSFTD